MSTLTAPRRGAWFDEFNKAYIECFDRIQDSESRGAVSTFLTETAKRVNHRATKDVKAGASFQVVIRGLNVIVGIAIMFEEKLGSPVAVQQRNNEVMHRQIAKELEELLFTATGFYDIQFLRGGTLLSRLRKLHATTRTCYEGVLRDMESIVSELEEQAQMAQESKMTI